MAKKITEKKVRQETKVLDADWIKRSLVRMCHEILEGNGGAKDLALVGIRTGGEHLAARIRKIIKGIEGVECPLGLLDITLYRDDLNTIGSMPLVKGTEMNFNVENMNVVLIDDVLFTGRTVRAGLDEIIEFGRPRRIQLAVLIDRGGRELPIQPDFVGKKMPVTPDHAIAVRLKETDGIDEVIIYKR